MTSHNTKTGQRRRKYGATALVQLPNGKSLYAENRAGLACKPRAWNSPEELDQAATEFFQDVDQGKFKGTIERLCLWLGVTPMTIRNYRDRDDYFAVWQKIKLQCRAYAVDQLFEGKPIGSIFYLKNNYSDDYKDKHEVEHNVNVSMGEVMTLWQQKQAQNSIEGQILDENEQIESNDLAESS